MKKEIYNSAFDRIKMPDECMDAILDRIDNIPEPQPVPAKRKKMRWIYAATAAAVFAAGTVGVTANENRRLGWISGFFGNDTVAVESEEQLETMADQLNALISDVENFSITGDPEIQLSPVGVLADSHDIYCMLRVDSLPEGYTRENLHIVPDYEKTQLTKEHAYSDTDEPFNQHGNSSSYPVKDSDDLVAFVMHSSSELVYPENTPLILRVLLSEDFPVKQDKENKLPVRRAEISFEITPKKYDCLNIDYNTYFCSETPKKDTPFLDSISVTPFSIFINGYSEFYAGVNLFNSAVILKMSDGTEIITDVLTGTGSGAHNSDTNQSWFSRCFDFDYPIVPDNVSEIYIGEMKVFDRAEYNETVKKPEQDRIYTYLAGMASDMQNFTCESECGLEISPIGCINDANNVYCMFRVDKMPDGWVLDNLGFGSSEAPGDKAINFMTANCYSSMDYGVMNDNSIFSYKATFHDGIGQKGSVHRMFLPLELHKKTGLGEDDVEVIDCAAKLRFDIQVNDFPHISIDYSNYLCKDTPKQDYAFLFDNIDITPISVTAKGGSMFYDTVSLADDFKIVMKDGSITTQKFFDILTPNCGTTAGCLELALNGKHDGTGFDLERMTGFKTVEEALSTNNNSYTDCTSQIRFDNPIDPDNISEIYLGSIKIFDKAEYEQKQ